VAELYYFVWRQNPSGKVTTGQVTRSANNPVAL